MLKPSLPENEQTRIETLHAYNILDSLPEERFDRLTRLAKRLFDVPIALVSLVDTDRQWFKSEVGLGVKETSREVSFCGHAILGDDVFEVPDTALDARFNDNPMVTDSPNIRFYAGYPLTVANGSKLGTLCLIDRKPNKLNEEDKVLLQDLAKMVELEIQAIHMATMDELTTLSNRRGFESLGQHALNLCKRLNKPATLFFFDLNGFKHINDQFGHMEGDIALKNFSDILKRTFRNSDVIARLSGDEFVILLTNTSEETAMSVLSRLQPMVDDHNSMAQKGYVLSFSVGMAGYNADNHPTVKALIQAADQNMYLDKKRRKMLGD